MAGVVDRPSSAWSRTLRRALARVAVSAISALERSSKRRPGGVELVGQPRQVGKLGFHVWSCNSSHRLDTGRAGIDVDAASRPPHARAPGWDSGLAVAQREPNSTEIVLAANRP